MSTQEREYFRQELQTMFDEWVSRTKPKDTQASQFEISLFDKRYMTAIDGQQWLPQATFRQFLKELDIDSLIDNLSQHIPVITDYEIAELFNSLCVIVDSVIYKIVNDIPVMEELPDGKEILETTIHDIVTGATYYPELEDTEKAMTNEEINAIINN